MGLSEHQIQELIILGLVFFVSLVSALALTPLADRLAWKVGLVDSPGGRKSHPECVTRAGGLAMALALLLTLGVMLQWNTELAAFWSAVAVLLFTGLLDDRYRLSSKHKFFAQILAIILFMYLGGIRLEDLGDILGTGSLELGRLAPWLTIFAMAGVINAFNMSDGLDGLAAGLAGIACLFFIPFAYAQESWIYLLILTGLFGVLLGFLRFNVQPARLFMGDAGSMFLGFSLAAAAVVLTQGEVRGVQEYQPITALIILSLPIADTLVVMFRRLFHGQNPFKPDKKHLHHRFMDLGISYQVSVSLIYGLMFVLGLCAWLVRPWPEWVQFYSLLGFYILLYGGVWRMERRPANLSQDNYETFANGTARGLSSRTMAFMARHGTRIFVAVWLGFLLPAVLAGHNSGMGIFYYIIFIFLLTGIYYPWIGSKKHMPIAHGLIFFAVFSILVVYSAKFAASYWFIPYMTVLTGVAAIWTIIRVWSTPRLKTLLPGSFELLLLGAAIVSPVLVHYSLDIDESFRMFLILSFVFSIPLFMMLKAYLRRNLRSNRRFISYLMFVLLLLLVMAYF